MRSTLKWLERGLTTVGVVLALWCVLVTVEARFFAQLPPPPTAARQQEERLPSGPADVSPAPRQPASAPPRIAPGAWLARLDAPSAHLSATVLEGTDDATLARGAGHIEETSLPGQDGNVGIAGHRDTVFRPVRDLKVGDTLTVTTPDKVQRYRIVWMKVVGPDDVAVLDPTRGPALTLVTCYPFVYIGHAPRRFIVRAQLVGERPRTSASRTDSPAGGSRRQER